jgi:ribosome-binding factor A
MKHRQTKGRQPVLKGPSQRQLRAGELIRHALVEVMREEELQDEVMAGVSVTVTEVRLSPDLRHAQVFVEPLGGSRLAGDEKADAIVAALNRHAKFLRGRLGQGIDTKFTPDLRFQRDVSFDDAERMARLFDNPRVREDLGKPEGPDSEDVDDGA